MKDIDTINSFISLRASGFTYKDIQEEIDVSKPTLVKWNKLYKHDIERTSKYLFCQLFAQNLIENKNQIILNTDILIKYLDEEVKDTIDKKNVKRAYEYLSKKFMREFKSINFSLTKYGKIKEVTFNFFGED
jgi:hypothetical protein